MEIKNVAWIDVQKKLATTDLLIVPLGATETYGHHMAMGFETCVAEYVAGELGARVDCLVAPAIPVTWSEVLDPFPGNLYAPPSVLRDYVKAICDRMVAWGIRRIFFLNVHGPNVSFLEEIGREYLKQSVQCAQFDFWKTMARLGSDVLRGKLPHAHGHASEMAVSIALAIRPELVFRERFETFIPPAKLADKYPDVITYAPFTEVTPTGHFGDPSQGTAEQGRELLRRVVVRMEQFLREWK